MSEAPRAFLGVEKSLSGRRWHPRLTSDRLALAMAQRYELPEILGRVMAARGVALEQVEDYLNPTLRNLMPAPSTILDMEKGASRLAQAVMNGEPIGIISDYDVDGVTSAAIMKLFLESVGVRPTIHVPDRITEGYGPSQQAVMKLREQGCSLLLTLDCGVLAHDPLAKAAELGMATVIVDHHQASANLPEAHAVINPNRQDDTSGLGYLCAAGVVMILVATTSKALRAQGWYHDSRPEPNLLQWLELVALATVCDVVPLTGLNRAYVTQGLKVMGHRQNLGLAVLSDVARLKRRPDVYALGYVLGPRINAAGRVGHAETALELLTTKDKQRVHVLAQELEELNRHRRDLELQVIDSALLQAEKREALAAGNLPPALIVAGEGWHPGILGLAAARMKERYNRPSFVLSSNKSTGLATGSGRSISGVDLGRAVRAALDLGLIEKGGGHAMAAGLTLKTEQIDAFRTFLTQALVREVASLPPHSLELDGILSASGASVELLELLEQAGPYGAANPSPLFAFPNHRIIYADPVGTDHIRCTLSSSDGTKLKAIAFRAMGTDMGELLLSERQLPLHIAGRLSLDEWGASKVPSLQIEDVAIPTDTIV